MSRKLLRNCVLLDPEAPEARPGALLVEDGRIEAALLAGDSHPEDAQVVDLGGGALAPGFVDLHFHGRSIFAEPAACGEALRYDAAEQVRHGTTSFLATTVAEAPELLAARVSALAAAADGSAGGPAAAAGARVVGIHLEGPWINPAAAGAQPPSGIREATAGELEDLLARANGSIRMVTLAPEVEGTLHLQETLTRCGVVVAVGHSLATPEQLDAAVRHGARHVTHLFNAMGPLHQRATGVASTALGDDRLSCDLICDGAHVSPGWVRVAARCKGDGLVLITDRVDPPGSVGGSAAGFGAGPVTDDGVALRLPGGQLAGSRVTLSRAIRNAVDFGAMTRLDAIRACTLRPALLLGMEAEIGTLRRRARADLAVLGPDGRVTQTWLDGEPIS